jgi:GNAT superfamily N-acetyltransferase
LIFDEDEDNRLIGFAAWRFLAEEKSIDGMSVGEIRLMGVVPDRQGQGVGTQLLANVLQVMFQEHGSDSLVVRIDVDTENYKARNTYERGWGFEHYRNFESGGNSYELLIMRPEGDAEAGA